MLEINYKINIFRIYPHKQIAKIIKRSCLPTCLQFITYMVSRFIYFIVCILMRYKSKPLDIEFEFIHILPLPPAMLSLLNKRITRKETHANYNGMFIRHSIKQTDLYSWLAVCGMEACSFSLGMTKSKY